MFEERKRASVADEVITVFLSIFGCPHRRTTFPRVRKDARGHPRFPLQNYVVCLDCGRELDHKLFDPPADAKAA